MKILSPYSPRLTWLRGNLHTHSGRSDGKAPFDEVVERYRRGGYDFLAVTEHDRFTEGGRAGEMLLLPAQECHVVPFCGKFDAHVVALGIDAEIPRLRGAQRIVDEINSRGGLAIIAHPRWSYMPYDVFDALTGYAAFEVFNGACEEMVSRGYSGDYWDRWMTRERRPLRAVAVDDLHRPERDFATGWTFVNAEKDPRSICDAIKRGDMYASSGPRIEHISTEGGAITLHTSSARLVRFSSLGGESVARIEGENVTSATYRPRGDEVFVRAEVHGRDGSRAWTSPFFIEP